MGDLGSIPELGRSPGEGNSYPLQYSGLEKPTDCTVHGVAKSRTRLSDFHFLSLSPRLISSLPSHSNTFYSILFLLLKHAACSPQSEKHASGISRHPLGRTLRSLRGHWLLPWLDPACLTGAAWWPRVRNPPAKRGDAGDAGSIPRSGRYTGGGNGNPLQYSCLGSPMERGPGSLHSTVTKTWTQLSTARHAVQSGQNIKLEMLPSNYPS